MVGGGTEVLIIREDYLWICLQTWVPRLIPKVEYVLHPLTNSIDLEKSPVAAFHWECPCFYMIPRMRFTPSSPQGLLISTAHREYLYGFLLLRISPSKEM